MKVLGSEAATEVADAAVPPWTQAERQLANKANSIFNGNVAAIASLIPTRTLAQVGEYVEHLPKPSVQRERIAPVLEPLKEGFATQLTTCSQASYTRPFGSRGSKAKNKHKVDNVTHTLAILRKQERLGVKHEYRCCTCALRGVPCLPEWCECIKANNFCEKYCPCGGALGGCGNGFPGCACKKTECRSVGCPCWDAFRECDPDVCTCSASGMLEDFETSFDAHIALDKAKLCHPSDNNPAACWRHRYDRHLPRRLFSKREQEQLTTASSSAGVWGAVAGVDASNAGHDTNNKADIDLDNGGLDERHEKNKVGASVAQGEEAGGRRRDMTGRQESPAWSHPVNPKLVCANMNLLMRRHQHLYMGKSDVAGWGVFVRDAVEKNEFVQEYTGEQMSQEEADRRGKIYDKRNSSYIFNLNNQTVLDAMRKGNKTRFANHSNSPNCFAKILLVRGDHRIGIFAKRRVEAGDELLYDYHHENHDVVPEWHQDLKPSSSSKESHNTKADTKGAAKRKHA